jgi:hypothetical protein
MVNIENIKALPLGFGQHEMWKYLTGKRVFGVELVIYYFDVITVAEKIT